MANASKTLTVREIETDDLPTVLAIRFSTRENPITREELAADYGITEAGLASAMSSTVRGWLCEEGGAVIAFSMGDQSTGEVQVVAVRPTHEGLGAGRRVLEAVCRWLFAEGHDRLWLRSNPDPALRAAGFYRHLGWYHGGDWIDGEMVLVLDSEP